MSGEQTLYDQIRNAAIKHPGSMTMHTNQTDNVANDITFTGVEGKSWYVCFAGWRVGGGNINSSVEIDVYMKDGDDIIYQSLIAKGAAEGLSGSQSFPIPIKITEGNTLTFHIDASGTAGTYIDHNVGVYNA